MNQWSNSCTHQRDFHMASRPFKKMPLTHRILVVALFAVMAVGIMQIKADFEGIKADRALMRK